MPSRPDPTLSAPRATRAPPVLAAPGLPLFGLTLLLVEDSRSASDALRLMALRSGARLRRAATLHDARRHLSLYRPDVVVVDPGLPDGSGLSLIAELAAGPASVPRLLALSGDPGMRAAALAAGAAVFLEKPVPGLAVFQAAVRPPGGAAAVAQIAGAAGDPVAPAPDPLALREDLAAASRLLESGPDPVQRVYIARFLAGVARSAGDPALEGAALALASDSPAGLTAAVSRLLSDRLHRSPGAFAAGPPAVPP